MACNGNSVDHCCYIAGERCKYLEENTVPGRHWACALRRELGAWDKVHADARYRRDVKERIPHISFDCGDYPPKDMQCGACGVMGG